jgi:predicted kinase
MSWSEKYKKSINCSNPKGFSQKAHCAGRKKEKNEMNENLKEIIIEILTEGVDDPGILKCVFMAGGPGSGKSYTAKEIFGVGKGLTQSFSVDGLKIVNSDTAFEKGLKDNGINPKDLARIEKEDPELWDKITGKDSIRTRAKTLTQKQQNFYEAGRLGMIIDGTGDEVAKIKKKKQHAEKLGYDCYMVFVNTSLEVALERNRNRDRVLSDDLVTTIWKDCQNNLGAFQTMFSGNFVIVDNTVYKPINKTVQKAVDSFLRKPIYNRIGKKWIQTARALKKARLIKAGKEIEGSVVNEGFKSEYKGNDGIIWKKGKTRGGVTNFTPYYKGHDIDKGGHNFKTEKELKDFIKDYILSNQLYNKYRFESVNETMKPSQVRSAISKVKKQLMRKWKQKGGYENFGQKELSQMKDKFDYNPYGSSDERQIANMLDGFDNWAMNYDGDMRESTLSQIHKAAKKGSYPVTIVATMLGKVVKQELVKTPMAVPAAFRMMQGAYPKARISVESKTGQILFQESLNEDKIQKFDDVHIKSKNLTGMVYAIKGNDVVVKTLKKGLVKAKLDDLKKIYSDSVEKRFNLFMEENVPTDPGKWSYYKGQAKKKFDVYPSAYANGWAAKQYKAAGGGWKTKKD